MGEIVVANVVVRESGYLYYVDACGNVCKAKMQHRGRVKGENKE